jgi:hypothetical protein
MATATLTKLQNTSSAASSSTRRLPTTAGSLSKGSGNQRERQATA